jgi:hypothetical protein
MKASGPATKLAIALASASLLVGSAASAATTTLRAVDPLVAVSMLGTASSQAAICAAGAASTAAAVQAAPAQPGCVLPVVDAPPPAPVVEAPPPPAPTVVPVAAAGKEIAILPLLLGLAAIAAGIFLLLDKDEDDFEAPTSPV